MFREEKNWASPGGRGGGPEAEQVNGRHGEAKARAGEGRSGGCPEFHKVMLRGVEKNTPLCLPGNSSRTGRSPGDLCEDFRHMKLLEALTSTVLNTQKNGPREYPEQQGQGQGQGRSHENLG